MSAEIRELAALSATERQGMAREILRRMGAKSSPAGWPEDDRNIYYVNNTGDKTNAEVLKRLVAAAEAESAVVWGSQTVYADSGVVERSQPERIGAVGQTRGTPTADAEAVSEQLRRDSRRYDGGFIQY